MQLTSKQVTSNIAEVIVLLRPYTFDNIQVPAGLSWNSVYESMKISYIGANNFKLLWKTCLVFFCIHSSV